jgi:hypothetical protein
MSDDLPSQRPDRLPQRPGSTIDNRWRWVAAGLGAAVLGAGGAAVFITDLEAGPVALLLVGAVFGLVAMSGRLPSRLKVGDSEAEWATVAQYVETTVTDASPDEKPDEVRRVAQLAVAAPYAASRALQAGQKPPLTGVDPRRPGSSAARRTLDAYGRHVRPHTHSWTWRVDLHDVCPKHRRRVFRHLRSRPGSRDKLVTNTKIKCTDLPPTLRGASGSRSCCRRQLLRRPPCGQHASWSSAGVAQI